MIYTIARERILAMGTAVLNRNEVVNKHNYVVLGGTTPEWMTALFKRLTGINLFSENFELFWIKMPGYYAVCILLCHSILCYSILFYSILSYSIWL